MPEDTPDTTTATSTTSAVADGRLVAAGRRTLKVVQLFAFVGGIVAALGLVSVGAYGAAAIVGMLVLVVLLGAVGVEALLRLVELQESQRP